MSGSIVSAVLMCHAPIVVPEVAGAHAPLCATTTRAMAEAARRLVASRPDVLVIVSPHTARRRDSFGVVNQDRLVGDFTDFRAPGVAVSLPVATAAIEPVRAAAAAIGVATHTLTVPRLDHGALVPLHFAALAGWRGPTLLLSLPWPGSGAEVAMGEAIAAAAAAAGGRWAFLASGDMSHRLVPGAPAGFHPRARTFDATFAACVAAGDLRAAVAIDPALRELAAEDVVDSVAVAAGAVGFDVTGHEKLAYEGPFGVGYLEAVLRAA